MGLYYNEREENYEGIMKITIWSSVSIFFVLILLALIALSTALGIILIVGIISIIISIGIFFVEIWRKE
jgi:hypothetical protein